jgi:hypothetical protein
MTNCDWANIAKRERRLLKSRSIQRELETCQLQRDKLLVLAGRMCDLLEDLIDGYPSEIPTIEKFRDKLAAIASASSGKERG